jgi:hypothetical protein
MNIVSFLFQSRIHDPILALYTKDQDIFLTFDDLNPLDQLNSIKKGNIIKKICREYI